VLNEKRILHLVSGLRNCFIIRLKASFQDSRHLHLVMEFVPGGEFLGIMKQYWQHYQT